jgi:hypothetical protein
MINEDTEQERYMERLKASPIGDLKTAEQLDLFLNLLEEAAGKNKIRDLLPAFNTLSLTITEMNRRILELEDRLGLPHKVKHIPRNERMWRP